jgi:RHS repeat-associated protein
VGWFSSLVHDVTHPGQLISDGEHWLGQVTDQGAHLVGRGLTDIGLGQAGNVVDGWGDDAASALDPELQLGQTDDPTQLIHGDPAAIRSTASSLHEFSGAFGQTASGLSDIDTSHWTGAAADAFRAKYSPEPGKWQDASTASSDAGGALQSYAGTVQWAQGQAREAIALYAQGQQATQVAMTAYHDNVSAYNAAAQQYDARLSAGQDPGPRPVEPGAFSDPGATLRERAQQILAAARAERDRAGSAAASVVSRAAGTAPASPGLWSQVGDTLTDVSQGTQLAKASFTSGVLTGVADIGKVARDVNPLDPWNQAHPAEYLAGLSGIGAGLVHDAMHPADLEGQVLGGGWGSDPAEAAGKLVPQLALAVATGGSGAAATDAGADAGADAAENAAAAAARSPGDGDLTTVGDPVDVATGDVIVPQTDIQLGGSLPLAVGRVHRSSYRGGRWFGRSWASTLDQRLVLTGQAVVFAAEDGMVLCYPRPADDGVPVLPVAGRRWPLTRDHGAYTVTDPQAGLVRRFTLRPGFYVSAAGAGELPLVSVTDRAGHKIRFGYSEDGSPESVMHEGGYHLKVVARGGRVTGLMLAGAGPDGQDVPLTRYGYDEAGDLAEVFNSSGLPLRFSYDDAGRMTGWTDRNSWSYQYQYNADGRCVRGDGPSGNLSATFGYDRDHDGRLVTTYTDASGSVTRYQITPRSQVAMVTDPLGGVTLQEHDRYGRLISRTDPLGRVTRWSYDAAGNLAVVTRPDGMRAVAVYNELNLPTALTAPDGSKWRQRYDEAGNLIRRTGPDGAVTTYTYDERRHLSTVTDPLGAVIRLKCAAAGLPVSVTDPEGAVTGIVRDGFGRLATVTEPDGSVSQLTWTIEGHLLSRSHGDGTAERFTYDGEGNLIEHRSPVGALTRFEYSSFNQMAARTGPDGTRTEFSYDHALRPVTVTHARLTWQYEYDPVGRLVAQTDYNGATTEYQYDAAHQLTGRVNAAGQHLRFAYDLAGNLTQRSADGVVTSFGYDLAGRLGRARNQHAELEFYRDAAGRVTAQTCNGRAVQTSYDAAGRPVRRVTPSGAQTHWDYDLAGRPSRLQASGQELRFGYDQAGRETRRDLPGGLTLSQDWDHEGRLTAQVITGGTAAASALPRLAGPGQAVARRSYSYRADGLLVGVDDQLSGPRRFGLDAAGRVTGVSGPDWAEQYAYDPAGNLAGAAWPAPPGHLAAGWAGANVQGPREYSGTLINRAGDVRYRHDACGRITRRQQVRDSRRPAAWSYTWSADDQLTEVITPDGARWRYLYDPLGRRIAKQRLDADGRVTGQTDFTWDGRTLAEQASAVDGRVVTWDYRPGTFTPLAQYERTTGRQAPQDQIDSQFFAIVTDLIGTPSELTAADGTLAGFQERTVWGGTLWHPDGVSTPLRFPGQYYDDETGLHYNNYRYYDPAVGRYLTPDPLGLAPAPNPHTYVANPHVLADPLGLDPASPAAEAAAEQGRGIHMALGLDPPDGRPIEQFARMVGGEAYFRWGLGTKFKQVFLENLNNPASRVSFDLTGIDSPYAAVDRIASNGGVNVPGGLGGSTDWELYQIANAPDTWSRITWYRNGEVVGNPFAK